MYTALECITEGLVNGLTSKYYHYTSLQACYGIIESNDLWMSDIRYLNDTKEILSCKRKALQKIGGNKDRKHSDLFDYYAVSFSKRPDSLSQWQTYADKNHGVCIEFDLTKDSIFRSLFKGGRVIPQNIIYDPVNVQMIINHCYEVAEIINENTADIDRTSLTDVESRLSKILIGGLVSLISGCVIGCVAGIPNPTLRTKSQIDEIVKKTEKYLKSQQTTRDIPDIFMQLSQLLYPFVKEKCFAREEEMRIVAFKQKSASMNVRHRCSNGIIIPYIGIQDLISPGVECNRTLPITKIIVGSSVSDKRTVQSIKDYLAHKKMSHVKVTQSRLSYISQSQ